MRSAFSKILPALPCLALLTLLGSCKVTEISIEEQSASLASYADYKISGESLDQFFQGRTATLLGGEGLEIQEGAESPSSGDSGMLKASFSFKTAPDKRFSVGTALAIDPRGYFLTAGHCLEGGEVYACFINHEREVVIEKAVPIWVKVSSLNAIDLALFRVEEKPYQTFQWGSAFQIGEPVFSAGSTVEVKKGEDPPLQFTTDSFAGVLKKTRSLSFEKAEFQLISHQSPVRRGNSGGPLANGKGELIGINYAASSPIQRAAGGEKTPMGYALQPDQEWVRTLIERDWAKRQSQ